MQKVGGRVVVTDFPPVWHVYDCFHFVIHSDLSRYHLHFMGNEVRCGIKCALDDGGKVRTFQNSGIARLSSGFGIKGCLVEENLSSLPFLELFDNLVLSQKSRDLRFWNLLLLIPHIFHAERLELFIYLLPLLSFFSLP